jgi:dTDP-glucose pyrophosphorylase
MTYANFEKVLVKADLPLIEGIKLMNANSMQVLLIVDDDQKLLGVITDGDVRRALLENISFDTPVSAVMTRNPSFLKHPVNKDQALSLMKEKSINHVPLVDSKRKVCGLLLWKDFFDNGDISIRKKTNKVIIMAGGKGTQKTNKVIIMAGGKGTRLDIFTKILPKPLIPIGDKPIIEHVIDNFSKYGFQNFTLSLNYKAEMIKIYFSDSHQKHKIDYIQEKEYLGTAGALALGRDALKNTFVVSNCDVLIDANMDELLCFHKKNHNHVTILGMVRNIKIPYGVLKSHKSDLEDIVEKPEYHFVINSGVYVLEPEIIDLLEPHKVCDMPDLLLKAKKAGFRVQIYPMTCSWFDVGQWSEYQRAIEHMGSMGLTY